MLIEHHGSEEIGISIEILHQLDDPGMWHWRVFINGIQHGFDYDSKREAEQFVTDYYVQRVIINEPTIGEGDVSKCLPGWIETFCKSHESGEGITLSKTATTALCHTLIAARVRAERLVEERNELQRYINIQERNGL